MLLNINGRNTMQEQVAVNQIDIKDLQERLESIEDFVGGTGLTTSQLNQVRQVIESYGYITGGQTNV